MLIIWYNDCSLTLSKDMNVLYYRALEYEVEIDGFDELD